MNPIQMVDLSTPYSHLQTELEEAILSVSRSGNYIHGEAVDAFAEALGAYLGVKHVIPCANGTDALQLAFMSLDLQPGDEVIVPAFTYVASAEAVALLQLTPVFVDVDPRTFNLDATKVEQAITSRTKAILPVHLFGQVADMEPLLRIAAKYGLFVVEDNAQSIGANYTFSNRKTKKAGTIGGMGTLSFFPTKNLACFGDGGAVLTNDTTLATKLRMLASHGQVKKYHHELIGCNSRLDTLQAAVLQVKLEHLRDYTKARQRTAMRYTRGLNALSSLLETPACIVQSSHVYNQYTLIIKDGQRDRLQAYLKEKGIPTMVYYPIPLHHQTAYRYFARAGGDLSVSEGLCSSVLSLPMHTELSDEQIEYIINILSHYE